MAWTVSYIFAGKTEISFDNLCANTKRVLFELHEFLCGEVWCVMAVVISCFGNLVVIFVEIPFEWYCQVIDDYNRLE